MIVTPEAEQDLAEARDFYEERRDGLGDDFLRAVGKAFHEIERIPESYRLFYREVRRALVRPYPFAIYYPIENDETVILAVIHSRRDPKRWKSRI